MYLNILRPYQLQRNVVAHKIYKECSSWIKKTVTSDSATNPEKRFKYEKEKRPEWIFNTKWCEGHPWSKYDRDENVMTCTICTKYGKRAETGNLKNKHHFITGCNNFRSSAVSDHEKSKGHLDALCIESN